MVNIEKKNENKLVKFGVWTPSAHIYCVSCHGNNFPRVSFTEEEWEKEIQAQPLNEKYGITTCERCGCDVQLDESVAAERELMKKLRENGIEAHMWQTGGYCSAVGIPMKKQRKGKDEYYYMVTYSFDGQETYVVSAYEEEGEWVAEKSFEAKEEHEILEKLLNEKDIFREWKEEEKTE